MPEEREGVIRFRADHVEDELPGELATALRPLLPWRRTLRSKNLLGEEPDRYGGYGFGNVSVRVRPFAAPPCRRAFLVSGSQTSGLGRVGLEEFALVDAYDFDANRVASRGMVAPSSESLSHAAIYELSPDVRAVLHVHAPGLWSRGRAAGLPVTDGQVEAGTPQMAYEIERLGDQLSLEQRGVVVMGGHRDGILAFGRDPDQAGERLLAALARIRRTAGA